MRLSNKIKKRYISTKRGDNMKKIFLYLYPIEEYTKMFLFNDDHNYDNWNIKRPLPIIDDCIQKRYRDNGYEIVFVLYPDRELFGLTKKKQDRIIFTDITFSEASAYDKSGKLKENFTPKYPNELQILKQLGTVDKLVVGGYHATDCVKRVAIVANELGIDTLIDLDLTDYFFHLYRKEEYFKIDEYSPNRYYNYMKAKAVEDYEDNFEEEFTKTFPSNVYGFYKESDDKLRS